jgi:hypothetical protein
MKNLLTASCWFKDRPGLLLVVAALLLFVLYLVRRWLEPLLIFYLAILIFLGLIGLIRLIQAMLRKGCQESSGDPKGAGSEGHPGSKDKYIPPHTYKRPDPLIYSQGYLMSQGLAVTWDNPDIQLYDGSAPVSSHEIEPARTYSIRAQIWNGSTEAPAVNMLVRYFYLSFGAGTLRHYIGQTLVDVPVKGAAGLPAVAEVLWTTPATPGHYCVQVELDWPDDANPYNNLGQENVNVKKLNSPNATFEFTLRNPSAFTRRLTLLADTYTLPNRVPCSERAVAPERLNVRTDRDPYVRHRPAGHPLPDGWQLDFVPGDVIELAPDQEQVVTVKVTARDGFAGQQAINVNVLDGAELFGGVTLYVHS